MTDIFISYKHEEQKHARRLKDALEHQGWSVWWESKLRAGERFDDVIEAALKDASCVIVMWSRRSVESKYVKDEATYALNRNKLVPLAIEEVDLPFRFEGLHTPQLVNWDGSETDIVFQSVVRDIIAILGAPPSVVAKEQRMTVERAERARQEETALLKEKEDVVLVWTKINAFFQSDQSRANRDQSIRSPDSVRGRWIVR